MLSSPMNSKEPSAVSSLKTRTVPFGRGMPILLALVLVSSTLLLALRFSCAYPPVEMEIKLYFLTLTPQTLGINSTCFWEFSSRVTGQLRVYIWQSEKDFSEKEGAESLLSNAMFYVLQTGLGLFWTVLTSPAISFSFAFWYLFPLLLSMVTQPPTSALVSSPLRVNEQSDFQENPVVLQATSQSVVSALSLQTFQLRVGRVRNPAGREGNLTPSMLLQTSMPRSVLRMYPLLQPRRVPLTLVDESPTLAEISMFLSMYFWRMALVLIRLASQFCSKTLMPSGFCNALKVTVSVWMLEETSVKQRSLLP